MKALISLVFFTIAYRNAEKYFSIKLPFSYILLDLEVQSEE